MANTELKETIRQTLIRSMDISTETQAIFEYDTPLFGEDGIGLDSVDALELVTLIYDKWKIDVPSEDIPKLTSVNLIADYIEEH